MCGQQSTGPTPIREEEGVGDESMAFGAARDEYERRAIFLSGVVQGVGFRPFVFGLAQAFGLAGFVKNEGGGVQIEVEGGRRAVSAFLEQLVAAPPLLARVDRLRHALRPVQGAKSFVIESSGGDEATDVFVSPDVATCRACLDELFDPQNRRFRYPFLNCTDCGPRMTIVNGVPYDRDRTTMSGFPMCAACRTEYQSATDRRFHAQPIACPVCGPRLTVLGPNGAPLLVDDPLGAGIEAIRAGRVVAIKGLGGFHLACDATSVNAVELLRRRKQRDAKPFAVMVPNSEAAARLCWLSAPERALLESIARPIVLLSRRAKCRVAEGVAPGNPLLGVMLPYTPLHHLLLHDLDGTPLVMTSGNLSDEPTAFVDEDAVARLADVADLLLTHDRPIHVRCDDSVVRFSAGAVLPLRRSRGMAPAPLPLPHACRRSVLAAGGQLKSVIALGRNRHALLSQHVGDLDHYAAYESFVAAVDHFERLFEHRPELIVHDLHPDYASTRYAIQRAAVDGIEHLAVQHHHAHMASCMAEHGLIEPVIGVAFDGTGFGPDGAIWGGEFLIGDCRSYRRAAHFRYVPIPGGERAIREPWRMGVSYLMDAGLQSAASRCDAPAASLRIIERLVERRMNAPPTSSVGRLFDAVAAIAGVRSRVSWEGQAAMELEWLAGKTAADGAYPFDLAATGRRDACEGPWQIDLRPLIAGVVRDVNTGARVEAIARRFHSTLAEVVVEVCAKLRQSEGLSDVVLSGGVFMNGVLLNDAVSRLSQLGFVVYRHRQVPPNDGGLALGQVAIAAAHDQA